MPWGTIRRLNAEVQLFQALLAFRRSAQAIEVLVDGPSAAEAEVGHDEAPSSVATASAASDGPADHDSS